MILNETATTPSESASETLGRRPWLQLCVGVPAGLLAASVAGATQLFVGIRLQGARSWDEALAQPWPGQPLGMALQVIAAVTVMIWVKRGLARCPVTELSVRGAARELLAGCLIGAAVVSAAVGVMAILGVYRVEEVRLARGLATGVLFGLGSGFGEEVVMRGILLRILAGKLGALPALSVTAAGFGALHLQNPHASWLSALSVAIQAGLLFGVAFLRTRRLWLPIGLHASWNYTQSAIFGLNVSGVSTDPGLFEPVLTGPEWLSGGAIGVEGSVITLALGLLAAVAIAWRRGERHC